MANYSEGLSYVHDSFLDGWVVNGRGVCTDTHIIIPETTDSGKPVVGINDDAFNRDPTLQQVTFLDNIVEIGQSAFYYCSKLTKINWGKNILKIDNAAFAHCNLLTNIVIPERVEHIGDSVFSACTSLKNLTIPNSVTHIGERILQSCHLDSLTVPFIGPDRATNSSFNTKNAKYTLSYFFTNNYYSDAGGILGSRDADVHTINITDQIYLPNSAFDQAYYVYQINILSNINKIGAGAFDGCYNITKMDLSASTQLRYIGDDAFQFCGLTEVVLPDTVTSIRSSVFRACSELTTFTVPLQCTSIQTWAFEDCEKLSEIIFPENGQLTEIQLGAFANTGLTQIAIPNTVTTIERGILNNCTKLVTLSIPFIGKTQNVEDDDKAFLGWLYDLDADSGSATTSNVLVSNTLRDIILTNTIKIGNNAFYKCWMLHSIQLNEGIISIGDYAFYNCYFIEKFEIPSTVTSIGAYAFALEGNSDAALTSFTFYNNIKSFGEYAFNDLKGQYNKFANIIYYGTLKDWSLTECKHSVSSPMSALLSTSGTVKMLNSEQNFQTISDTLIFSNDINEIKANAFANWRFLKNVSLSNSVTTIGTSAFEGCTGLTSFTIPDSVTNIGFNILKGCTSLTSLTIPYLGAGPRDGNDAYMFAYLFNEVMATAYTQVPSALKKVVVTDAYKVGNANRIYSGFAGCENIEEIEIRNPSGDIQVIYGSFADCKKLEKLTIPNVGPDTEGGEKCKLVRLFSNVAGGSVTTSKVYVKNLILTSETSIPDQFASGVTNLQSITLPDTVTSIGTKAFYNATSLTTVNIPIAVTSIGAQAFEGASMLSMITYNAKELTTVLTNSSALFKNAGASNTVASITFKIGKDVEKIPSYLCYTTNYPKKNLIIEFEEDSHCKIIESNSFNCASSEPGTIYLPESGSLKTIYSNSLTNVNFKTENSFVYLPSKNNEYFALCKVNDTTLTNITILPEVKVIAADAFQSVSKITEVHYNSTIENWILIRKGGQYSSPMWNGATLWINGSQLTNLVLPNTITELPKYSFYGTAGIASVLIPLQMQKFEEYSLYFPDTVEFIYGGELEDWQSIEIEDNWVNTSKLSLLVTNDQSVVDFASELLYQYIAEQAVYRIVGMQTGATTIRPIIAAEIRNKPVIEIADNAFEDTAITSIVIPNGLTRIGAAAFKGCIGLVNIEIDPSIIEIDNDAFADCTSLKNIAILRGIGAEDKLSLSIGATAFSGSTAIEKLLFRGTQSEWEAVMEIEAPAAFFTEGEEVTETGRFGLPVAAEITCTPFSKGLKYRFANVNSEGIVAIVTGITEDFTESALNIPPYIYIEDSTDDTQDNKWYTVAMIDKEAFKGLASVTLEDGNELKVTSLIIPKTIKWIDDSAFANCTNIAQIEYRATNENIYHTSSSLIFANVGFTVTDNNGNILGTKVVIGKEVEWISRYLFFGTATDFPYIVSVEFEEGSICKTINERSFSRSWSTDTVCYLKEVTVPESITEMGSYAFAGQKALQTIHFNAIQCGACSMNSNASIGVLPFQNSLCQTINIGPSVTVIPQYLFYNGVNNNTKIEKINFDNATALQSIETNAFYNCQSLIELTIPTTVTTIKSNAFYNCTNLATLNYNSIECNNGDTNQLTSTPFSSLGITVKDDNGNLIGATVIIGSQVEVIPQYLFQNCKGISRLEWKKVTDKNDDVSLLIATRAFQACSSLTTLTIPERVTSLDDYSFAQCTALTQINYNAKECSDLSSAKYPFGGSGNKDSTVLYIGKYVEKIPAYLFGNSSSVSSYYLSIKTINFAEDCACESIGQYAFGHSPVQNDIKLPNSLTVIGSNAFESAQNFTKIILPTSLQEIGTNAFSGCATLTAVKYEGTLNQWCNIKFDSSASNPVSMANSSLYVKNNSKPVTTIDLGTKRSGGKTDSVSGSLTIRAYTFANYEKLDTNKIILPDNTTIEQNAFYNVDVKVKNIYCEGKYNASSAGNRYLTSATIYYYAETTADITDKNKKYWKYSQAKGIQISNGTNGMFINTPYFKIDSKGRMRATDAEFTGKIVATEGIIGGCEIQDGTLKIGDANISGKISADHLDITSASVDYAYVNTLITNKLEGGDATFKGTVRATAGSFEDVTLVSLKLDTLNQSISLADMKLRGLNNGGFGYTGVIYNKTYSLDFEPYIIDNIKMRINFNIYNAATGATGIAFLHDGSMASAETYGNWDFSASTSATSTDSDANKKHEIQLQPEVYSQIFDKLEPVIYKYNNGTSDRIHTGLIAQLTEQAVLDVGLTTKDFAAVCYEVDAETGEKKNYGIRYEELVSMCIYEIQRLKKQVKELESQNKNVTTE